MNNFLGLINSMSPSEYDLLIMFYKVRSGKLNKEKLKILQVYRKLPASGKTLALPKTLSKLKMEIVEDIIGLCSISLEERKATLTRDNAGILIKKSVYQSEVLYAKGFKGEALNQLIKAKKIADAFELLPDLVVIKEMLIRFNLDNRDLSSKFKELRNDGIKLNLSIEAKIIYTDFMIQFRSMKHNDADKLNSMSKLLEKLKEKFKSSMSFNNYFYYYHAGFLFHKANGNYKNALNFASDLYTVVSSNVILKTNENLRLICLDLSVFSLEFNSTSSALSFAKAARSHEAPGSFAWFQTYEIAFLAVLRNHDFESCEEILKELTLSSHFKNDKSQSYKWNFFKAWLYFYQGLHDLCHATLKGYDTKNYNSELVIGYHFLQILNLLELRKREAIPIKIDSLNRILMRNKQDYKRHGHILKILKTLMKHKYSIHKTIKQEIQLITDLKVGSGDFYWDPLGYEILRFDTWLEDSLILKDFQK